MNAKLVMTSMVLAVFIFLTATTFAQVGPYEQYPSGPDYLGPGYPLDPNYQEPGYPSDPNYQEPGYPSDPNYPQPGYPSYPSDPYNPVPQQGPATVPGSSSGDGGHPSDGPSSMQPLSAPSGSSTEALNYAEGQSLSLQEVSSSGMMASASGTASGSGMATADRAMAFMMVSGLQIQTWYNGMWTTGPASVFFWRSTSILSNNDQAQTVWSWEGYPSGQQVWKNMGYRMPGYFHGRFTGDSRGWHKLAMWGSRSGWSNVVWIYVR